MNIMLRQQLNTIKKNINSNIEKLKDCQEKIETFTEEEKKELLKWIIPETIILYQNYLKMLEKAKL